MSNKSPGVKSLRNPEYYAEQNVSNSGNKKYTDSLDMFQKEYEMKKNNSNVNFKLF